MVVVGHVVRKEEDPARGETGWILALATTGEGAVKEREGRWDVGTSHGVAWEDGVVWCGQGESGSLLMMGSLLRARAPLKVSSSWFWV